MASPFRFFRKYQTWFYVVLGVLLMFAFVVLPPVADYLSRGGGRSGPDKVVVEWKYGKITQSEIRRRMMAEYIIQDFQNELVQRALAKKGLPKTTPVAQAQDERELVRRLVLAKKAESLGIVINEDALLDYFDLVSDQSLKNRQEYLALLKSVANKRLNYAAVLDQLRVDLLSQRMIEISIGSTMSLSPGQLWQYYQKLHRQVVCDILPISAESQLDKVPQSAPESELRKLYDEGKDRYPDPLSPKPGFKIRRKASFGYFEASFNDFLQKRIDEVLPTITDEEVKRHYEQNKRSYQITDLPPEEADSDNEKKNEKKDDNQSGTEKTGDAPPEKETKDTQQNQPKKAPGSDRSANNEAGSRSGNQSDNKKAKGKTKPKDDKAPPPQSSHRQADSAFYILAQQDSPEKKQSSQKEQPNGKKKGEKPAKPQASEQANKQSDAAGGKSQGSSTQAKEASPATGASSDKPQGAPKETDKPAAPVRYKPLNDELKKEIREKIARERVTGDATTEMQLAIEAARRSVERYANAWALWKDPALKREKPKLPDFAALARKYGLQYHTTPPLDLLEIVQLSSSLPDDSKPYLELLQATELNLQSRGGNPTITFRDLAARMLAAETADAVPRYQPQMIASPFAFGGSLGTPQQAFLFWVAEVQPERVPQFDEVRDQVTEYWRYREAYRRAAEQAKQVVAQADAEKKPLKEVLSKSDRDSLITTEPFSWMTPGAVGAAARQSPMLSPVRGKNGKGEEVVLRDLGNPFMEDVFQLRKGKQERTTTHDLPEKTAFAVELVRELVSPEQLRELFLVSGSEPALRQLAQEDQFKFFTRWFEQINKEFEVKWVEEST